MDYSYVVILAGGAVLALLMARSAVIVFWPDSLLAQWCDRTFDFVDQGPTMTDGDGSDACGADSGGDGGD